MASSIHETAMASTNIEEKAFEPEPIVDEVTSDSVQLYPVKWYRSTIFNTIVVSLTTFMGVGMFTALQNTGAGGLQDVTTANASLALAWGPMIPVAWFASAIISKVGPRIALCYGACGYVLYGSALYVNTTTGNQWFLMLGAFFSAMTSGVFFPTEGAIILMYPEPWTKGRCLALWQSVYRSSNIIGGGINLAFNANNYRAGGLAPDTYLVFVGLMVSAPFVALLLSKPSQVQRKDRSPVPAFPSESIWVEFRETMKTLKEPKVWALSILWSQPLFAPALLGTVLGKCFSVRVRALNSILLPVLEVICFQIMGWYIDKTRSSVRRKMTVVFTVINTLAVVTMIWVYTNIVITVKNHPTRVWDWSSPGFGNMYASILLALNFPYICFGFYYTLAMYSFPTGQSGVHLTRVVSQLRAAEAGGAAVAFGMLAGGVSWIVAGACNLVLLFLCVCSGGWLLLEIRKQDLAGKFGGDTTAPDAPRRASSED